MSLPDREEGGVPDLREAARCLATGEHDRAAALLWPRFRQQPLDREVFRLLADVCTLTHSWDLLEQACRVRLELRPEDEEALCRSAQVELSQRRYLRALGVLELVVGRNPANGEAWLEMGRILKRLARCDEAIRCFRHAVAAMPAHRAAQDNLLFMLLFSDTTRIGDIAAAHRNWGAAFPGTAAPALPVTEHDRVVVGYLSPDLREHSVASFIEPVLRHHDRERFHIVCYQCGPQQDQVTARLRSLADEWRDVTDLPDEDARALIVCDRVSILVDLAGHTAWNRLPLMALRPAPVQMTWIGYPHSTGLTQIDYRITDAIADPPGMTEQFHSERLARLPGCFLCFDPPAHAPPPAGLPPVERNGSITFGCFNNLAKVSPVILACWRKILEQTPGSRLAIKSEVFDDQEARAHVLGHLGLPAERVETLGWSPDRTAHLALYNQIDIALDTWPYNGTTTTCEALWMGVPVISLAGSHHAARVGASLLTAVGLEGFVASSPDDFIGRAVGLAGNLPLLRALRRALRPLLAASPLLDGRRFTGNLEALYREVLRQHCAGDASQ